jgi:EmrB/QacA subfamily drug resistance transporter
VPVEANLSAATDESTWVLTSYLASNAIMLPTTGWISRRIGRKRLMMTSILMFTLASMLCGMATNMPMLIFARILQGIGGGAMMPLAQSILLESFPPRRHGTAMAVYGLGVVVAPVIGPTLGGWITDSYSWRWIFFIHLPVGFLAALAGVALAAFIYRKLRCREPIVQLRVLGNRNFAVGTLLTAIFGFVLYGVTAMLPCIPLHPHRAAF